MKKRFPIILFILLFLPQLILAQSSQEFIIGNIHTLYSDVLNETREYRVEQPES